MKINEPLEDNFIKESTIESAEALELFLEAYLVDHPYDTAVWIKLALTVYHAPLYDYPKAEQCMRKVLEYDPTNVLATLLLVYIVDHYKYFDDELFKQLCSLRTDDNEYNAMIEYAKTWYYFNKDDALYEAAFEKSIEYCDKFVLNYIGLGQHYIYKRNLEKGYYYLKKGLNNIKHVQTEYPFDENVLDVEVFLNERFKGICLSDSNYKIILDSFDPNSPWITGDFNTIQENKPIN